MSSAAAQGNDQYQMTKEIRSPIAETSFARKPACPFWTSPYFRHALWLGLLLPGSLRAVEPVQLAPYPQKVRTFYRLTDAAVPAALRLNSVPLPVDITATARAIDGAVWLGTTQGLMRLDFAAPERDRRQYLAGKRYLPDDRVEQLVADGQNGVWARTRTGVSHIELKPMTLAQKAEHFEQRIRARHDSLRLGGRLTSSRCGRCFQQSTRRQRQ